MIAGITYGLYLTLSSWVLFHVATKTEFFRDHLNMFSLNNRPADLREYCNRAITGLNRPTLSSSSVVCAIPEYQVQRTCLDSSLDAALNVLDQCMTEQLYVRDSISRALMYIQVSSFLCPFNLLSILCLPLFAGPLAFAHCASSGPVRAGTGWALG